MNVFLDTNILLDTLVERPDRSFTENSMQILSLGENGVLDLYISALSIPTIAYVLKNKTSEQKKTIIKDLTSIVKLLPSLPQHVDAMLEGPMRDIEDALQVQSAKEGQCDLIITRNARDFTDAGMPVLSPEGLLERIF